MTTKLEDVSAVVAFSELAERLRLIPPLINAFCPTGKGGGRSTGCPPWNKGKKTGPRKARVGPGSAGKAKPKKGATTKTQVKSSTEPPATLSEKPKAIGKVKYEFFNSEKGTVDSPSKEDHANFKRLFGKELTPENLQTLAIAANATKGATVEISTGGTKDRPYVETLIVTDTHEASRTFTKNRNGELILMNESFRVKKNVVDEHGTPLTPPKGADLLANQVRAARELGVTKLMTYAAGNPEALRAYPDGYVGFKVWPKLGYDGDLNDFTLGKIPPPIRETMGKSKRILDLYKSQGGREWWANNGSSIDLEFDLGKNSRSVKALEAYLHNRDKTKEK